VFTYRIPWVNLPNQRERNVCCLNINEGGMGMINIDNFVKSKQIKFICKIINSEMDSCNAIDKHWLQKYDNKFGVDFFLCKCSNIKGLVSIFKPNDFFIFSLSSDFSFLTKFSGIDFFYFCPFWYPVPFIIQSIKYSLIINKGNIVFVPYIVYFKYIISQKRLKKVDFY
jgi:hypothetical protein